MIITSFFFFQAEDGIRDGRVTGVQTCALPISARAARRGASPRRRRQRASSARRAGGGGRPSGQIGRASCRERVEVSVGGASLRKRGRTRRCNGDGRV